jgi:hypothetical protein
MRVKAMGGDLQGGPPSAGIGKKKSSTIIELLICVKVSQGWFEAK